MRRTIKRLESAWGVRETDRIVSSEAQLRLAHCLYRIYGDPTDPEPTLSDFHPRRKSEIDAEFRAAIERVYAETAESDAAG